VLASNPESCAWLDGRAKRSAERLLIGILNRSVQVEFVVTEEVSA
jgi:hypothetical protein